MTVKFVILSTQLDKKRRFIRSLIEFIVIMFKWFCFCFVNGTLADLVKPIDCFTKLDVTMALPLVVFELNSITASLGDFASLSGFSAC